MLRLITQLCVRLLMNLLTYFAQTWCFFIIMLYICCVSISFYLMLRLQISDEKLNPGLTHGI